MTWPLTCFVCRGPILETYFKYPMCDDCLDALLVADGISPCDIRLLRDEWDLRQVTA